MCNIIAKYLSHHTAAAAMTDPKLATLMSSMDIDLKKSFDYSLLNEGGSFLHPYARSSSAATTGTGYPTRYTLTLSHSPQLASCSALFDSRHGGGAAAAASCADGARTMYVAHNQPRSSSSAADSISLHVWLCVVSRLGETAPSTSARSRISFSSSRTLPSRCCRRTASRRR